MFKGLMRKWNVSARQFWVIFTTFGCTGITTAYLTKQVSYYAGMTDNTWWVYKMLLRVGMLLFGYQLVLLFFGALFGQWKFFWNYELKILRFLRILKKPFPAPQAEHSTTENTQIQPTNTHSYYTETTGSQTMQHQQNTFNPVKIEDHERTVRLAIFASGAGSNANRIIEYFRGYQTVSVALIVCNKPGAGVIDVAERTGVPTLMIEKERFFRGDAYLPELAAAGINFIVLAGFLWKVPSELVTAYPRKIINIHPALLPLYGGKGMYGDRVHTSVVEAGDVESGITIHYVDEHYDSGDIIFQARCTVESGETAKSLSEKIHTLEYEHFPRVIEELVNG